MEKKDNEIYNDNAVFTKLHDQGCLGYCEHTQNLVLSQSWDIRERFCGDYLPLNLGAKGYINVSSKKERRMLFQEDGTACGKTTRWGRTPVIPGTGRNFEWRQQEQ